MCVEFSHSLIVQYLIEKLGFHPQKEDIKTLMKQKYITVKFENDLAIFNYNMKSDFNDPIVREARGIIIDIKNMRVVCWGFDKFFNYGESYAARIDWKTAQVQEKVDGSILKLWYYNSHWNWSTNSCINAADAISPNGSRSFYDIVKSADNFKDIDYNMLDKYKTYIFELVSPENRVVIEYPYAHLYHIGTRSNLTGAEFDNHIGIEKPKVYDISKSLEEIIKASENLNEQDCLHEGFVVRDADYHRIKVKNSKYLELHHSLTNGELSKKDMVEAILNNDEEKIQAILEHPALKVQFKYWDWLVTKFLYSLELYIRTARVVFNSMDSRKDFAHAIRNDKLKMFGFMAIDHMDWNAEEIVKNCNISRVIKFIEE